MFFWSTFIILVMLVSLGTLWCPVCFLSTRSTGCGDPHAHTLRAWEGRVLTYLELLPSAWKLKGAVAEIFIHTRSIAFVRLLVCVGEPAHPRLLLISVVTVPFSFKGLPAKYRFWREGIITAYPRLAWGTLGIGTNQRKPGAEMGIVLSVHFCPQCGSSRSNLAFYLSEYCSRLACLFLCRGRWGFTRSHQGTQKFLCNQPLGESIDNTRVAVYASR